MDRQKLLLMLLEMQQAQLSQQGELLALVHRMEDEQQDPSSDDRRGVAVTWGYRYRSVPDAGIG